MHGPHSALLWELWRMSRWDLSIRVGSLMAIVPLIAILKHRLSGPEVDVVRGVLMMFVGMVSVLSASWMGELDRKSGFCFRQGFTRPITTRSLVCVPMLASVAAALTTYLIAAAAIEACVGFPMPNWGPLPLLACCVCVLVASVWGSSEILGKYLCLTASLWLLGLWLAGLHRAGQSSEPVLMTIGRIDYFAWSWFVQVPFLAMAIAATWFTVKAVERQRCGEGWRWGFLTLLIPRLPPVANLAREDRGAAWMAGSHRRFFSPWTASVWYEARRAGVLLRFAIVGMPLLVLMFVAVGTWMYKKPEQGPAIWLGAILLCPGVYQLLATDAVIGLRQRQGGVDLSPFDATRPMRCDQLIAVKLMVVAVWSLVGCAGMAMMACLATALSGGWQHWETLHERLTISIGDVRVGWWIAGITNSVLLFTSQTAMLLAGVLWLALHPRIFVVVLSGLGLGIALLVWDFEHGWQWWSGWLALAYLVPTLIILACLLALFKAIRSSVLSRSYFLICAAAWLIYVTSSLSLLLLLLPSDWQVPTVAWLILTVAMLLPLASVAFAPLALSAHRHA